MAIDLQIQWLFLLALPIACVAWTVTHEELFREPHEYCVRRSQNDRAVWSRKFFYLFTCEYCFSHYVTVAVLLLTDFRLLIDDWRGYVVAGFALVWIANIYMSLFALLRQGIKKEKTEIKLMEQQEEEETSNQH